jgi:hypothetical protein
MLLGTGAALAGAALIGPGSAAADDGGDLLHPTPLPQPTPIPLTPLGIHINGPGPKTTTLPFSGIPLQGDADPSAITDYSGFTALAYPVGTARGSNGQRYLLEGDMRVFSGKYTAADGQPREATWGFVWIDLYTAPGPGNQVHDFNGGIQPSGLFWVVELPQGAFQVTRNGTAANLHASNVPVIDSFQFGGTTQVPAMVSYSMKWQASGPFRTQGDATYSASFAPAKVEGSFSGRELGFSFSGSGIVNPDVSNGGYALLGKERNGKLLHP